MSDVVTIEIVRAIPVVIVATLSFASVLLSFLNHRHLRELKISLNSSLHDLLALTAKSSRAEGALAERERTKDQDVTR